VRIPGYDIMRPLAKGGTSTVFLAVQHSLGRKVAIKILRKGDRPSDAARFLEEGRIVASLNHRNVITVYDVGVTDQWYYIAMEYLRGGSLEDRIKEGMSVPAVLDLMTTIAGCLDFLHQKGIVHRDVKPANILFHEDGTPKLTDFGIAKQVHGDQELTMDGAALGSPYYLSPEQAGARPLDGRSDVYSLGIVFFEMLTGEKPFRGDSYVETMMAQISQPVPELPEPLTAFQELLERMVAKDPNQRFSSAAELLGYLEAVQRFGSRLTRVAGGKGLGEAPPTVEQEARAGLSVRTKVAVAALGVIALVVTALLFMRGADEIPERPDAGTLPPQTGEEMTVTESQPMPEADPIAEEAPTAQTEAAAVVLPGSHSLDLPVPEIAPTDDPAERLPARMPWSTPTVEAETATEAEAEEEAAASPAVTTPEQIEEWLAQARSAMEDYRLTTPQDNNAYHYHRQVLEHEPDNAEALKGQRDIANIYATLAHKQMAAADLATASLYVTRGLMVVPGHLDLLALQERLDQKARVKADSGSKDSGSGFFTNIRNFFTDPPPPGEKRQSILEH